MASMVQVILYSTTLHAWEVWANSRPLGYGSLEACQLFFPDAEGPSLHQARLADSDRRTQLPR